MAESGRTKTAIPELDVHGLRQFGLTTGLILVALFGVLIPWFFGLAWPRWPWVVGGMLASLAVIAPSWLRPIYAGWMRFGLIMSRIMTPLILGVIFYLVISPVALLMKGLSRDSLKRKLDPKATTYRTEREALSRDQIERPY